MSTSAQALNALKNKMQSVRDELDKYRDLYEDKCRQHQDEINKTNEVSQRVFIDAIIYCRLFLAVLGPCRSLTAS